jgi:Helix-turn-helix domain
MVMGDRLRTLRETKKYSQGEIERRTGLFHCYISRVENGHTIPAIETPSVTVFPTFVFRIFNAHTFGERVPVTNVTEILNLEV